MLSFVAHLQFPLSPGCPLRTNFVSVLRSLNHTSWGIMLQLLEKWKCVLLSV